MSPWSGPPNSASNLSHAAVPWPGRCPSLSLARRPEAMQIKKMKHSFVVAVLSGSSGSSPGDDVGQGG